jgi:hypothetical protein
MILSPDFRQAVQSSSAPLSGALLLDGTPLTLYAGPPGIFPLRLPATRNVNILYINRLIEEAIKKAGYCRKRYDPAAFVFLTYSAYVKTPTGHV